MKLYLHCGYHKTGSSFLQTLFSRNRDLLQEHGYHFPVATREYDMMSGNISPGNGPELAAALKQNNSRESSDLLAGYVAEAQKKGCEAVLLSSENFFHAFDRKHAIECLVTVTKENGIGDIRALLYFRDPVSHALSTFKHRAKKGTIPDYTGWLEKEYETMGLIKQFLEYREQFPIEWICRKYSASSEHMAESAFAGWLGVTTPEIPEDDRVNTSLTLSELIAIQTLNEKRPSAIPFVQQAFSEIPGYEKGQDRNLNKLYSAEAYGVLAKEMDTIEKVNALLPLKEQLVLNPPEGSNGAAAINEVVLTKAQIRAFADAVEAAARSEQVLNKSRALLGKVVDKINRKMKTFTA